MEPTYSTSATDVYIQSDTWIEARRLADNSRHTMTRTGITPPGYPTYPVYGLHWPLGRPGELIGTDLYVLEAGRLWETQAWRAHFREHLCTPAETEGDALPWPPDLKFLRFIDGLIQKVRKMPVLEVREKLLKKFPGLSPAQVGELLVYWRSTAAARHPDWVQEMKEPQEANHDP